jgi:hypothetical protein
VGLEETSSGGASEMTGLSGLVGLWRDNAEWRVVWRVEGVDPTEFFGFTEKRQRSIPSIPSILSILSILYK